MYIKESLRTLPALGHFKRHFPAAVYLLWQGCKQQASHHLQLSAVRDKDPRSRYPSSQLE